MQAFGKEVLSFAKIFLAAIVLAYIINYFFFAPYIVKGESMHPNLQGENKLVVNKLSPFDRYKRFDVIVFHAPDKDAQYVKRVIGLPGDTIRMEDDVLYINDKAYDETYLKKAGKDDVLFHTGDFTLEELTGYEKVPKDCLFVLGDNREISKDSRYFGLLSRDAIIGKVVFRVWPFDSVGYIE